MPREKNKEIRIDLCINMFSMDQPLSKLNELVRPSLLTPLFLVISIEQLFDMVPDIHPRLILPGVDKRDLHVSRD
jgi:hypothetical protein